MAEDTPIRDAVTLILVRDQPEGLELLTMERATTLNFSAGATVFPGGKVDATDLLDESYYADVDLAAWQDFFGCSVENAKRLLTAAVRETFEEVGVLFARTADGVPVGQHVASFAEYRELIENAELPFGEFLARFDLVPDFTVLHPVARWITPPRRNRRFDTRFIAAALPETQEAQLATTEATSMTWTRPQQALDAFTAGRLFLMPPTWEQMRRFLPLTSVAELPELPASPQAILPEVLTPGPEGLLKFPHSEQYYRDLPTA